MAVSFLQRAIEGAFMAPFQAAKHGFMGAARNPLKGSSYKKHAQGLWNDLDSNTVGAIEDTQRWLGNSVDVMKDKNRSWARRGLAGVGFMGKGVFGVGHTTMALGMDAVKAPINIGARAAGFAVGTTARAGALAAYGIGAPIAKATAKGSWWLGKKTVPGAVKTAGLVGGELAKDTMYVAGGTAKAIWKHRDNPMLGSALVGGGLLAGAVMGNSTHDSKSMYGTEYGGYGGQDKGMGYMNPEIQAPAWQLTKSAQSGIAGAVQQTMNQEGGYGAIQQMNGPLGDGMGATGDLVFALNALRNGGMG